MANVKISQLPSLSTMTDSAIIPVVASDATQQISGANLKTYFSSVAGNITGGNLLTAGLISATGAITGATITGTSLTVSNGNITAGNLLISGAIIDSAQLDIQTSANNANIVLTPNGTGNVNTGANLSATGNITGGNVLTGGQVIASGVIQSGTGLSTGGYLSVNGSTDLHDTNVTGNLSASTVTTSELTVNIIKSDDSSFVSIQDGLLVDGIIETHGNVTADYFIGNGSQLTGLPATYGNANVVANLAALGSNPISSTGNITTTANVSGNYILGNGSQLTGIASSYGNANVANYLPTFSGNISAGNISAAGNIAGNYFIGNGAQLTGISTASTGNVTFNDVNIIGTGNLNLQPNGSSSEYLNVYLTGAADIHVAYGGGSGNVILGTDEEANVAVLQGGNVAIQAGNVSGTQTWTFDTAGNLTLPGNIIAINYADGNRVTGGVTFNGEAVIGTGTSNTQSGLYLAPDPVSLTNDLYLRVRGNILDEPTHIHFDTGNNQYYNQFIGDDNKYIQLANTGNIVINTNDYAGNTAQWNFGTDGDLTFPTGNLVITPVDAAFGNSAVIASEDHNLITFSTGANGGVSSLWVEDIGNVGTSNIAAVYANPTPGSKIVRIAVGQNGGGGGGPNLWDFNTTGNLTLPGGSQIRPLGANLDIVAGGGYVNLITADESSYMGVSGNGGFITSPGGTWQFDATGNLSAPGNISAVGNVTAGNISAGSGTITGGNVNGANFNGNVAFGTGTVGGSGNITGGNILTAGIVSATGNVTSGNLSVTGNVTGNTAGFTIGYLNIPQVSLASNVTTALADSGKHYYSVSASNLALTIANNTSVSWPIGTAISIVNANTGNILINQGTGVSLYLAGNATAGNRVLSTFGMATIMNTAANVWFINGTGVS